MHEEKHKRKKNPKVLDSHSRETSSGKPDKPRGLWSFIPPAGWCELSPVQSSGYQSKLVAYWWGSIFCGLGVDIAPTALGPDGTVETSGVFTLELTPSKEGQKPNIRVLSTPPGYYIK